MATVTFEPDDSSPRLKQTENGLKSGGVSSSHPVTDARPITRFKHPWENRKALSENYEVPVSGREGWWRSYIRETPRPGSYESASFVDEISWRPNTYRFKSDGRKIDPQPHNKGALLLPGAYDFQSFLDTLDKKPAPATYNFKGSSRDSFDVLNFGRKDKELNVSPAAYQVESYLTVSSDKAPSKHSAFKSQVKRFPTLYFKPKEGPGPGYYESQKTDVQHPVSSSFRSRSPRFVTSHTKVPGPGSYEKIFQFPIPPTVAKMGRQYGLFFTSAFQT